jgi:hypothetical protein
MMNRIFYWPITFGRQFPARLGRFLGVIAGVLRVRSPRQLGTWAHAAAWGLFDVTGGPELAQILLRVATETRPLTAAEIEAAAAVLGAKAIRYDEVRLAQEGVLRRAFKMNGNRAFATWHTIAMPAGADDDVSLIVHELTHVYQYERRGSVYIGQGLGAQRRLGHDAYRYGGAEGLQAARAAGTAYCDYNREQQGQIAQDYCRLLRANEDTIAYEPYIAELKAGLL